MYIFWYSLSFLSSLFGYQGSDSELKVEKDGVSDSESKVDSGVPEVPVPPDDTPEVLNKALSGLSSRYRHFQGQVLSGWMKAVFTMTVKQDVA